MVSIRQRQELIIAQAYEKGHVTVKDLANELGVSEATIRRDLRGLADQGQLQLTHGGAYVAKDFNYSFRSKAARNVESKRVIGKLASELVKDGDQIFLDSGTTCFEMAKYLRAKQGLSVIVNSLRLAEELSSPGVNVVMLGGQYRPERLDTVGPLAMASCDQLRGYLAIIGVDGIEKDFGLAASDIDSSHLFRLAARNARETVLVADSSKFNIPSLYKIVGWESVSRVITDVRPSRDWEEFFSSQGIDVIFPDGKQQEAGTS